MSKIVVIGEIVVEIMADTTGDGFREPLALTGPFPSGAPAIFADQIAKMGASSAIVSTIGEDDFGHLVLKRLSSDGVDVSAIAVAQDRPTGSAFVRYKPDGTRNFIFNIRHSACGLAPDMALARPVLDRATHLHVMGSSLSSRSILELNVSAAKAIKARGGSVSFDPNLRSEMLDTPGMREAMLDILACTDLYLPSGNELTLLTRSADADGAIDELLALGVKAIAHKRGADGVDYYDREKRVSVPAFSVAEVDPTGAGDCFGAAFTALWLKGTAIDEALKLATAAGAIAVTMRGPMEGTSTLPELIAFVEQARTAR